MSKYHVGKNTEAAATFDEDEGLEESPTKAVRVTG